MQRKVRDKDTATTAIPALSIGEVGVTILGLSPFIYNAMSAKVRRELLRPRGKKTSADKAATQKHNPLEEFRQSVYARHGADGPTRLIFPAVAFKRAIASAALDIPGLKKSEIGRRVWAVGQTVDMYGIPQMRMDVVRMADMNHTPDVRTRAILPEWCCFLKIQFVSQLIKGTDIGSLFRSAGLLNGVGDFRQEKGAGSFGQFTVAAPDDPAVLSLMGACGLKAQDAALADPAMYDRETEELYSWWCGQERLAESSAISQVPANGGRRQRAKA